MAWVREHIGRTILILLALIVLLWVFSYVMFTSGGGAGIG